MKSEKKIRHYSEEYLKFAFIRAILNEHLPFCLLCQQCLTNESMKRGRLEAHLKAKHSDHIDSGLNYFQTLKHNFEKRKTLKSLFSVHTKNSKLILEASYEISKLIAKSGKDHTIGENLIKPSISTFLKIVLGKDDKEVKTMPLSNNTVSRRIDEMSEDIEKQLIGKLKTRKFSVQMDESTLRGSEAVLIVYVRYIDKGEFFEEMLFCKSLESTTTAKDIFKKLKDYLEVNNIPIMNISSCVSDGAPNMMGKNNGCLKLMKDENPEMIIIHCVIHRENLAAKNISPVLNEVLNTVVKCINYIKATSKTERLFKLFCEEKSAEYVRLLLHTEIRWLSKGNCLKRFMELFDIVKEFLNGQTEFNYILTGEGKAFVS
ncbi:SCAN domain-containing protein 3 [Dictyocoela muelleri]|nr:SCAN domain-containing protein 3 [Dictyocoela muelleri]